MTGEDYANIVYAIGWTVIGLRVAYAIFIKDDKS